MNKLVLLAFSSLMIYSIQAQPLLQWQKCFGGGDHEESHGIAQTSDGGYLLSAFSRSNDGDVSGNHGNGDFWMAKMDSSGLLEWQKCVGGADIDIASGVVVTQDGEYVVAGSTNSFSGDITCGNGLNDGWVFKTDSSGTILWQTCVGSYSDDFIYCIQLTSDGGYIVCGSAFSYCNGLPNNGSADAFFVKLDSAGTVEWQNCYGGSSTDYAYDIHEATAGGYIAIGYTFSNNGDVSGNHLYNGNPTQDIWVIKLSNNGTIDWQKCLGGTSYDLGNSITNVPGGGYFLSGQVSTNDGDISGFHGVRDAWIAKLSPSGNLLWQKCLGGSSLETSGSIKALTNGGYIFIGGTSSNNGDVSGNHGADDVWVVRLDDTGGIIWKKCYGGSLSEAGVNIISTSPGKYTFTANTYSNNGDVSGNHDENGDYLDCWVVRLGTLITGEEPLDPNTLISVFPNPSTGVFTINTEIPLRDAEIQVWNMMGQLVRTSHLESVNNNKIDLTSLPSGTYFINVLSNELNMRKKIVVKRN